MSSRRPSELVPSLLWDGPVDARVTLVLAHGAGAAMDHPFMNAFARGLAARRVRVARFEFPYMAARRRDGRRRAPDREPVLRATWAAALERVSAAASPRDLVIGGKSMGGRIASLIAADGVTRIRGLVCLGYPFHPVGKPTKLRTEHLARITAPTLIVQGTRDAMGSRDEVAGYGLPRRIELAWIEDGDHGLTPRKRSGRTLEQNLDAGIEAVAAFLEAL